LRLEDRGQAMAETQNGLDGLRLLSVREVAELLGISVRSCWRLSALAEAGHGTFPRPLRLSAKVVRWRARDVQAYLDALSEGARP